jgi:2'-hydroxyisoflavone reductase
VNILVIGGTRFLGPHFVTAAMAHEHRVTVFNRGSRRLPETHLLRQLRGDRRQDYRELGGETFDAVVDTCAYHPHDVAASAAALLERCERYCLISSASVYAEDAGDLDESAAVAEPLDPIPTAMTPETYGALKAMCERIVQSALGSRSLVVRPGLIVGPGDTTHRFGYWVRRIARGGDVVAPEPPNAPVEFIDVRDLAAWLVLALERGSSGTYNADGPAHRLTMSELLDACAADAGSDVRLRWISAQRLAEFGVEPWTELPLWIPPNEKGFLTFDSTKARREGLTLRPLGATIAAMRAWDREHGPEEATVRTLTAAKEAAILADAGVKAG